MIDVSGPTVLFNGAVVGTQSDGQGIAVAANAPVTAKAVNLINDRRWVSSLLIREAVDHHGVTKHFKFRSLKIINSTKRGEFSRLE